MKNNKLNSIRLNQIIDSNKIDTETFVIVYLESLINRTKLIKKYFGECKELSMDANCKINNVYTLETLYMILNDVEKSIKNDDFEGIKMHRYNISFAKGK